MGIERLGRRDADIPTLRVKGRIDGTRLGPRSREGVLRDTCP